MLSVEEMPIVFDGFELDRCFDDAHSDRSEIDNTEAWPPLPLPQKFPARRNHAAELKCAGRRLISSYMAKSRMTMGTVIDLEESARWSCRDEDVRTSACSAAVLILMHAR